MKIKKILAMIEILAVTCLVSVGFSSWVVVNTYPEYKDINVATEGVINVSDYISDIKMSFSEVAKEGFVNDYSLDSSSPNIGYLKAEYTFNLDLFKQSENFEGTSLLFETKLELSNSTYPLNIISYFENNNTTITYTIDSNAAVTASKTVLESDDSVTFSYRVNSESFSTQKSIKINFNIAFDLTSYIGESTFEETVYSVLNANQSIPFNIVIAVNDGD